jgi:hypothetical protein
MQVLEASVIEMRHGQCTLIADAGTIRSLGIRVIEEEAPMKRLVRMWTRRRRGTRMVVFKVDRPRRIDPMIDPFGERLLPVMVSDRERRKA